MVSAAIQGSGVASGLNSPARSVRSTGDDRMVTTEATHKHKDREEKEDP
jgi:hypothetical protein